MKSMKYHFGGKLRIVRERRRLTMKEVAEKAGVSESLISQIERNRISPAIDTLLRIAEVLDIDFEFLFSDYKKVKSVNLVRNKERDKMIVGQVTYERLSKTAGRDREHEIEAYLMVIEKGGRSGSKEYGHRGNELGLILEGEGEFRIGSEVYTLKEGDSISFSSDVPHAMENKGEKPLRAVWVITPPKMFVNNL